MAKSLVERLDAYALALGPGWHGDSARVLRGVSMIAKPYEDRRLALEKVAERAMALVTSPMIPTGDNQIVVLRQQRDALRAAIAAVPEIPEES
jgi:hypothetical protein